MRVLIRALEVRPRRSRARAERCARQGARGDGGLERNVVLAAERIDNAMQRLEQTTTTVTSALLRASSGLGDALTTNVERIQIEVAAALTVLESQRKQIENPFVSRRQRARRHSDNSPSRCSRTSER